jgi:hypothetical protein
VCYPAQNNPRPTSGQVSKLVMDLGNLGYPSMPSLKTCDNKIIANYKPIDCLQDSLVLRETGGVGGLCSQAFCLTTKNGNNQGSNIAKCLVI